MCHTWFTFNSGSPRSLKPVAIVSNSSSPTMKSMKPSPPNKADPSNHHSNNEKMKEYFTQIRSTSALTSHPRCVSNMSESTGSRSSSVSSTSTWRQWSPQSSELIEPSKKIEKSIHIPHYRESSFTAEFTGHSPVTVSPIPHFQRVLNLFY